MAFIGLADQLGTFMIFDLEVGIFVFWILKKSTDCINALQIAGSFCTEILVGRKKVANQRRNDAGFIGKCQSALDERLSKIENALLDTDTGQLPKAIGNHG